MKDRKPGGILDTIKTVFIAVLVAFVVRTVAYEPFNIPSGSMIPSLLVGDYLFVSKFSYGYSRHSLPFSLPLFPGRVFFTEPERGDVAVFKLPRDTSTDYIKRVIGLPGDRIQMIAGVLHINDQPVQRQRVEDYVVPGLAARVPQYLETLPNGRSHRILELTDQGDLDDTPVYAVPEGHYFMMGDNRDNSVDSRVLGAVGYVPRDNLVGRAEFLFLSTDGSARFWEVWKWPGAIRTERLFSAVR